MLQEPRLWTQVDDGSCGTGDQVVVDDFVKPRIRSAGRHPVVAHAAVAFARANRLAGRASP
jgi:hypothetical protein